MGSALDGRARQQPHHVDGDRGATGRLRRFEARLRDRVEHSRYFVRVRRSLAKASAIMNSALARFFVEN